MKGAPFRLLSHCMDDITTTHFLWTEKIGNFYKMGISHFLQYTPPCYTYCRLHHVHIHVSFLKPHIPDMV